MNDIELYKNILGIKGPWDVTSVQFDLKGNTVTIKVGYTKSNKPHCPECNEEKPIYNHRVRRWRHPDTCQMTTIIECDVPHV